MSYLSPTHSWGRICKCIAVYPGEFDHQLYQRLANQPACIQAVAQLMQTGVVFNRLTAWRWCFELCGSFEVTAPSYKPPVGSRSTCSSILFSTVQAAIA